MNTDRHNTCPMFIIQKLSRAETAHEKWRGKNGNIIIIECMRAMLGAMLGVNHEEYREINGWHIITQ